MNVAMLLREYTEFLRRVAVAYAALPEAGTEYKLGHNCEQQSGSSKKGLWKSDGSSSVR